MSAPAVDHRVGGAAGGSVDSLLGVFTADLRRQGLRCDAGTVSAARALCDRFGGPDGFAVAPVDEQLSATRRSAAFVDWLVATGRIAVSADYLMRRKPKLGQLFARCHPGWHARFLHTAAEVGFAAQTIAQQWVALAQACAVTAAAPHQISYQQLTAGRDRLAAAARRHWAPGAQHNLYAAFFSLEVTLFHAGVTDRTATARRNTSATPRSAKWAGIPQRLSASAHAWLDQLAISLRPATVACHEIYLRDFARFLTDHDPTVISWRDLRRGHVEAFKHDVASRTGRGGRSLHRSSLRARLSRVRAFLEHLVESDHPDAPPRVPIFSGDFPIKDQPLPRFLDDAAATKLLQAARNDPDPFVRLVVEVLARTGLRKSELVGLRTDAVVQIGSAHWLRVPVGKLHTDRYIPLHPQLKDLLDDWLVNRPESLRSDLIFIDKGRPIPARRVDDALDKVAAVAGLGNVTPHQLRHTLATQAINLGMSLEAIAALLGHKTLAMTMVYARIADRTVADEYFAVSEKVEALYDQPRHLPADAEGAKMAKLRREMHERMLGNGYCVRPPELDCHFESICEACTFFRTTIEFRPTLERQRDDAAAKGQTGRHKLFADLLTRLDGQAS
ncbi:MAG: tyrosine-type recombinase/integrase [Actinomycetota bacterium]|nr:tyrosine-type recombinase/integrase [Actinomycetota bacterium]